MSLPESIHEAVKRDLDRRAAKGMREYGVPLTAATPALLRHLYEELLDAACYVRALMEADEARDDERVRRLMEGDGQ